MAHRPFYHRHEWIPGRGGGDSRTQKVCSARIDRPATYRYPARRRTNELFALQVPSLEEIRAIPVVKLENLDRRQGAWHNKSRRMLEQAEGIPSSWIRYAPLKALRESQGSWLKCQAPGNSSDTPQASSNPCASVWKRVLLRERTEAGKTPPE